jgi:alkaline phosphatase
VLCAAIVWIAGASEPSVVRFGLFTDLHAHDIDSPLERKWMTHTAERLGSFTSAMNDLAVDFVVQLGDFINGWVVFGADPGDPARIPSILAWADGLYAAFHGPRFHVVGNHDVFNLDKSQIRDILGIERSSLSFDVGGFHFVILDVQYAEDGSDLANTYSGVAGYIPDAELAWLRDDLAVHATRPAVVFVHQMLDSYVEEWGRPLVANQADVQRVLSDAGNVIAVLQGHDHAYAHDVVSGVHYVTFEALVDRGGPPSWAVVTLDASDATVTIEGTGEQPNLAFSYAPTPAP